MPIQLFQMTSNLVKSCKGGKSFQMLSSQNMLTLIAGCQNDLPRTSVNCLERMSGESRCTRTHYLLSNKSRLLQNLKPYKICVEEIWVVQLKK